MGAESDLDRAGGRPSHVGWACRLPVSPPKQNPSCCDPGRSLAPAGRSQGLLRLFNNRAQLGLARGGGCSRLGLGWSARPWHAAVARRCDPGRRSAFPSLERLRNAASEPVGVTQTRMQPRLEATWARPRGRERPGGAGGELCLTSTLHCHWAGPQQ